MKPFSLVVSQVAPSKTALQSCDSHAYSILREELLARGSAMRMCHLLVTLSVQFANADTAQKAHYRPDTDNRSDNWCITRFNYPHANIHPISCQGVLTQPASLLCLCFTEAKLPQCSSLAPYSDVSNTKGNLSEIG